MPMKSNEKPDSRLMMRIVSGIGVVFGIVVVIFFVRSAPDRSPDFCVVAGGAAPSSQHCFACHENPHLNGTGYQIRRVDALTGVIETFERNASLRSNGIVTDAEGTRYGANPLEHVAWKQRSTDEGPSILAGVIARGRAVSGFSGDGKAATTARLNRPSAVAVDDELRVYIADTMNHRIRRVDTDGTIETLAGVGRPGADGDGGPALDAELGHALSLAFDASGKLLVAHGNGRQGRVRSIDLATGAIDTLAGSAARPAHKGDGGPAREAVLKRPVEITVDDATGDLYIAESRPVLRHWNIRNCARCHGLPPD
ncbi:hypothetical protein HN371_08280 [Candidatus Poribacteria bacterium]|jgi:hypothetical protein|nr:hypothetical protein [Candidatus Poribacteria bacterium]MBT5532243.1 hypothetical protein [Candidatus Poribacteria bacterium]MBT7100257.1 hypothetical protein [Candidatus Poribacteria bacterium]MBT7808984.1 hypothetical protein [Candidatus Poribacteria bacterium]